MDFSKVFCIDLTKYNQDQLSKISGIVGLNDGALQEAKATGVRRVYFHHEKRLLIGELVANTEGYLRHYKNLIICEEFAQMTKKEKDKLIKLEPYKFNTKKNGKNEFFEEKNEDDEFEDIQLLDLNESEDILTLTVDSILDKISKSGIDSLTKAEKEFLDNESKK